jgi:hypothetical protein
MKTTYLALALLIAGFLVAGNAYGQDVLIQVGFFNGHKYLELNDNYRKMYLAGMADGINLSPIFGETEQDINWVWYRPCTEKTTKSGKQIRTIVDNYLNAHPEKWDLGINIIYFQAMLEICKK